MRDDLQFVLRAARELPVEQLPRFLGELEECRCTAMARLTIPASVKAQPDELLGIEEAARRLNVSRDYLYRHSSEFSFTRRVGRKLLFSASGIEREIRQLCRIDSKTAKRYI